MIWVIRGAPFLGAAENLSLLFSGRRPLVRSFDERSGRTRRRGIRLGWKRWQQTEPPYHYEWRWVQLHVLTWDRLSSSPALKVQLEVKTYRAAGGRSVDQSKRYLRFGVCL